MGACQVANRYHRSVADCTSACIIHFIYLLPGSLHSSDEPGELSQWLCHDESIINIVLDIIIIIIIISLGRRNFFVIGSDVGGAAV